MTKRERFIMVMLKQIIELISVSEQDFEKHLDKVLEDYKEMEQEVEGD